MTAPRIDRAVDGFVDPQPQDKVERGILELGQVADGRRLGLDRPVPAGSSAGWAVMHDQPARRP
jgi:hypothetical protein